MQNALEGGKKFLPEDGNGLMEKRDKYAKNQPMVKVSPFFWEDGRENITERCQSVLHSGNHKAMGLEGRLRATEEALQLEEETSESHNTAA